MNITSAKYYKYIDSNKNAGITAIINEVVHQIPIAEDNTDYQNILKWEAEGNTIEEAD
jgi:hypothetical protein